MTPDELIATRKEMGLSQTELAADLDMTTRGFQKLEAGESEIRKTHILAIDMIKLQRAIATGKTDHLTTELKAVVQDVAALLQ